MVFSLFKKQVAASVLPLTIDVHSHLLPGIDDGVESWEESLLILEELINLGYHKVITTPHVLSDHYPNTPEIILSKLRELKQLVEENNLSIEVEAAAEYFLDETFLNNLENNEKLLTFGDNYLLFETSFINKPTFLIEAIFKISSQGYKPVLAHPERYIYMQENPKLVDELVEREVFLQLNINSLTGYYSKGAKKFAEKLIDKNYISFLGSDCHNERHLAVIKEACGMKYFKKITQLNLLNNTL
ncbi:capsular biosynthesis protein [Fulvivirgaceae bacterium BMA12]|uniref:protein-tyrosine-phosphatase n=1 Tax=Agaribacillus aureus TaxID=3051825 RepID=A0ABT8LGA9_9BACT|nr:capsular biosynthesis protein [Fulvivirgaceae bacterium BMA12]